MEYANALYLKDKTGDLKKVSIIPDLTRKINILTLKYRPKCNSSGCVVGFRWYQND